MPNYIIRTSEPDTYGGDPSDIQVGCKVEVIDSVTGDVLHADVLQFSSLGLNNDPAEAARVSQEAADIWAKANAEQIAAGERKRDEKAVERATAKRLLDAIAATPDQVKTREELGIPDKTDALPVDGGGVKGR